MLVIDLAVPSSDRNPLDDVPRDSFLTVVVETHGPRAGVTSQVLDVLKRNPLLKQIRDRRDAERVGREPRRQACALQPALYHSVGVDDVHGVTGEPSGLEAGGPGDDEIGPQGPEFGTKYGTTGVN